MPGFWGQYGPKVRSADFLGPLHYAYDHFDHRYRRGAPQRIQSSTDDLISVNYTFSNLYDTANFVDVSKHQIIPICFVNQGQVIRTIISNSLRDYTNDADIPKMGYWLFSADLKTVWTHRISPFPFPKTSNLNTSTTYMRAPTNLDTKSYLDLGIENIMQDYTDDYKVCAVDLNATVPPFIVTDEVDRASFVSEGFYLCLCMTSGFLTRQVNQVVVKTNVILGRNGVE